MTTAHTAPEHDNSNAPAPVTTSAPRPTLAGHIAIMRIDHWIKQVFVVPGVVLALVDGTSGIPGGLPLRIVLGFVAVCLVASSNYVINEVLDAPFDRSHPVKCHRPVPSGKVSIPVAYAQWIILAVAGIGLGLVVNFPTGLTVALLWVMGCVYNIPPIRSKNLPYLDVLSESINNPLRMLAGWYMVGLSAFAPSSLLISYWMVGCYFMAIKRYAEFRDIDDPARARAYRKSFGYYTLPRLLVSIIFYASAAMLFLGAFIMRYRLELVLAFPFIALVMAIYLSLAFEPESAVINPEKLYRERNLMLSVCACAVVTGALMFIDIPVLDTIFKPTGLRLRGG